MSSRQRTRIVMVIRLLNGRFGGAERLFCDTANLFAEMGHSVTCVRFDAGDGPPAYRLSSAVESVNLRERRRMIGSRVLQPAARMYPNLPPLAPAAWLARNLDFTAALARFFRARRPDVVISYLPPANTPALIAGALARVPVVPTNHNVPARDFGDPSRWDPNPVDRALRVATLRLAARVHVLFPSFVDWFPPAIRRSVVAIPNFVSDDFVGQPASHRREVLAAGRLAEVKNYGSLVEAWAEVSPDHPDWTLRIFGSGPEESALREQITRLRLGATVRLDGFEPDMPAALRRGAFFAHPAKHEGFGLAVAEALTCGLPVIAFADCPGVNELVVHERNGLLVRRGELAGALRRLIEDQPLREHLAANATASMERFSKQRYLSAWESLFRELRSDAGLDRLR